MDRDYDEAEGSTERTHTPEEQAAFDERVGEMAGYVNLLEAHDQALAEKTGPGWFGPRTPVWWAIGVLLVGILIAVIAFYGGGSDTAAPAGDTGDVDVPVAGEQAGDETADESAAEDAAEDTSDDGAAADSGGAASSGADAPAAEATADVKYLLDLASEVVAHTGAANAAVSAGDKGEASEHILAVKPIMTEYIDGGGDLVMPEFSEAQNTWLRAANSYVSGNTGALADMQAAYDEVVAALEHYEAEAAKD